MRVTRSGRTTKVQQQKRASFIQPLTAVIRNYGQLSPAELAVYLDLQTYDWSGDGTWVGQKTIARELGIGERTVRDAVKALVQVGAIGCQSRPGQSNLYRVNRGWVPADPGNIRRRTRLNTNAPTPAEFAGDPGTTRRTRRHDLPHPPAESAAETDTKNYTQQAEPRTDWVPPPAASEEPLSETNPEVSQEDSHAKGVAFAAEKTAPLTVSTSNKPLLSDRFGMKAAAKSIGNIDYSSVRPDPAEEALVVELANKFNQIQAIMGGEKATGIRWQKFLTGFRMLLFSGKHGRSYEDVSLVLDYLRDNPMRSKEIVNKDKKRGITNTYHLMFLFDRLHNEAVGREFDDEKKFSKRKIRIPCDQIHPCRGAGRHCP